MGFRQLEGNHPSYRARLNAAMKVNIQIARILPTKNYYRTNYFLFKRKSA